MSLVRFRTVPTFCVVGGDGAFTAFRRELDSGVFLLAFLFVVVIIARGKVDIG